MEKNKRYTLPELRAMRHAELVKVAKPLGVRVTKSVNKTTAVKRIMAAYAAADVDAGPPKPDATPAVETHERKPDFERLVSDEEIEATMATERRGGPQPGSGRPPGMTAKKARLKNLPQQPHEIVLMLVTSTFDLWAIKAGVPEIALTKDEAVSLALPLTRLGEYYGLTKWLPEELMLWVAPVWTAYNLVKLRRRMIVEAKGDTKPKPRTATDEPTSQDQHDIRDAGQRQDDQSPSLDSSTNPAALM